MAFEAMTCTEGNFEHVFLTKGRIGPDEILSLTTTYWVSGELTPTAEQLNCSAVGTRAPPSGQVYVLQFL